MTTPIVLLSVAVSVASTDGDALSVETYSRPPDVIADAVLAPWSDNVRLTNASPDRARFLLGESRGLPPIADFAMPFYRLAGMQIDPIGYRARQTWIRGAASYTVLDWRTGAKVELRAPGAVTLSAATWSPDGERIAFFAHMRNGTFLWIAEADTGATRRLSERRVLATEVTSIEWSGDSSKVAVVLVPSEAGLAPAPPAIPPGPQVRLTEEGRSSIRTYPDLLETPYEARLLEHYLTGQLAVVDAVSGEVEEVGAPAMIRSISLAPDGEWFRVSTTLKPFSYTVPYGSFGTLEELWDKGGKAVAEIRRNEPRTARGQGDQGGGRGGQQERRRSLQWRPDGVGMSYIERVRSAEGAPQRNADQVVQWLPPYGQDDTKVIYENDAPIGSLWYAPDCETLFFTESAQNAETLYAVRLDEPGKKIQIYRRRTDDFFDQQGSLITEPSPVGVSAVKMEGSKVFLSGTIYDKDPTEKAPRPFVDEFDLDTKERKRIFFSSEQAYESVVSIVSSDTILFTRETPRDVPDTFARIGASERRLTNNRNYVPAVTLARRERIRVTRPDGIKFWVEAVFPPNASSSSPGFFWFYPREYADQEAYDQSLRTYNKNRFRSIGSRSMEILTLAGYVVVLPDCPIIGPNERKNDLYVHDLRNNLSATIDALAERRWVDRKRLGIGGHSYGAFSTANALIHTPFFKAGIAGDGNYNRTLTPMAFQSEQRLLWEARGVYEEVSPLLWAERMTGALLMYHGADDQNVGTFPINSWRMFEALNALGKEASLYMYPLEDHGPAAQETVLDLWARWVAWLDKYVKAAGQSADGSTRPNAA
ncbi:MAG: prolyl oligopeptidase family serine peptidase [Armatimonadota bacterium]